MELTYSELSKRDVINVVDGKCLGKIVDIKLNFPAGKLEGIFVPGCKGRGLFRIFDKSRIYIEECKILKIGGDVILVELKCGDVCEKSSKVSEQSKKSFCPPSDCHPSNNHCNKEQFKPQQQCSHNPCKKQQYYDCGGGQTLDLSGLMDQNGRIDTDDY